MKLRGLLAALVAATIVAGVPAAHGATRLALGNFGDMVVDPAHSHVFVSSRDGGTSVVVLDYDGNVVDTIPGLSYPWGMALDEGTSTLYVAESGGSTIATVDTSTLEINDHLSVAPWTSPRWLALAGGRLCSRMIASPRRTREWLRWPSTAATCKRQTARTFPTTARRSRPPPPTRTS